jgi:hypothetical protein
MASVYCSHGVSSAWHGDQYGPDLEIGAAESQVVAAVEPEAARPEPVAAYDAAQADRDGAVP